MNSNAKFVLSKSNLINNFNMIKKNCDIVSYSAKTNYEVAELLEELTDCNFSMHSGESLSKIKDKKRIWFFAQGWSQKDLFDILNIGVKNFVIDNENDLNVLLEIIKRERIKINLFLRIRLKENTIHTGKYYVYGMYFNQVNNLIPFLRKNEFIEKLGLHMHRKTQNISEWSLQKEISEILTEETLNSIDYFNIGGGIPVKYKNFRADVINNIFLEIQEFREWINKYNIKLIIEPGRFIAAPCIKLITEIKNIYNNNIIIDCSVYNSAIDIFATHYRLEIENELNENEGEAYTVKGITPCSMDIFRYKVHLNKPKIGDKIIFLNAGAYNFSSDFCNLNKIRTEIVD